MITVRYLWCKSLKLIFKYFLDITDNNLQRWKTLDITPEAYLELCQATNSVINPFRKKNHCVKSVQIRSFFWPVISCIKTEYRKIRTFPCSELYCRCWLSTCLEPYWTKVTNCYKLFLLISNLNKNFRKIVNLV